MPMYPELMVVPMREELTRVGIQELTTAADVDQALKNRPGTTMVVVNSICGCAAGRMRPAVRMALQNSVRPDQAYSVFAGQDTDDVVRRDAAVRAYNPQVPRLLLPRQPREEVGVASTNALRPRTVVCEEVRERMHRGRGRRDY